VSVTQGRPSYGGERTAISGGSKNFEGGAKGNLSAPSSFIANAHNEIYAFYTEKVAFWKKYEPIGGQPLPPLASPL